jgi:TIR domain
MPRSIFLSYDSQDAAFIEFLGKELNKYNLRPLSVNLKINLDQDIFDPRKLAQVLPGCDQVIIVVSKAYAVSTWLLSESLAFFKLMDPGSSLRLAIIEDCDVPFHLRNLPSADFRDVDLESLGDRKSPKFAENLRKLRKATKDLVSHINKDPQAFIIMKFGDEGLDSIYENAIAPAFKGSGYTPVRIDKIPVVGSITTKTLEQIAKSDIVLADLTGGRPNCYYETGYAHALGKEMILTIRKRATKHFSLSVHQFIEWTEGEGLKREIMTRLEKIRKRKESFPDETAEGDATPASA